MKLLKWKNIIELSTKNKNCISFINGSPDQKICEYYYPLINKTVKKILKRKKSLLFSYSSPQGNIDLRTEISKLMKNDGNFNEKNILITNGAQQALKLIAESLLKPGEVVLMETPTYIGVEKPFVDKGATLESFPDFINDCTEADLEKKIIKCKPKLVYLIPDFSNPTGNSLTLEKRKLLVNLAKKYNFLIIEDQTYRYLFFDKNKTISSISSFYNKTLVIGTISKFLVPGLRIGWIASKDKKILDTLILTKESNDLSSSNFDQQIVFEVLKEINNNEKILKKVRIFYEKKMSILVDFLEKYFSKDFEWKIPNGGYYIWLKSKNKINTDKLFCKCLKFGVSFSPGSTFYLKKEKNDEIRLSISSIPEKNIVLGLQVLAKTLNIKTIDNNQKTNILKNIFN